MTRQEQIEQEAKNHSADVLDRHWFKRGAEWADQHPQWRPVEDELPQGGETVLANDGKRVVMATYQSGPDLWFRDVMFGCVAFNPTHWMPLPASPATEGGEL